MRERLKALRKEKKVTQKEVAEFFKIDQSTYAGYESGKSIPSPDRLSALADFFGVSTDYLLGRSDIRRPDEVFAASSTVPYEDLPPEVLEKLESYKLYLLEEYRKSKKE